MTGAADWTPLPAPNTGCDNRGSEWDLGYTTPATGDLQRDGRALMGLEEDTLNALRSGGCVLVMRHASSSFLRPDSRDAKNDNTLREQQLDGPGRLHAQAMGEAMRRLGIGIQEVFSSPAARAYETARLIGFGQPQRIFELDDMSQTDAGANIEWLENKVTSPPPRTNVLIVTHLANILCLSGEVSAVDPGEALVFRPQGVTPLQLLARIPIRAWLRAV